MSLHTTEELLHLVEKYDTVDIVLNTEEVTVIVEETDHSFNLTSNQHWTDVVKVYKPRKPLYDKGKIKLAYVSHSTGGVDGDYLTCMALVSMFTWAGIKVKDLNNNV